MCEAVASNRLEGVTATVYYEDNVLDSFGMPTGEKTAALWNADDYDQINPLITDSNGQYAWDVPEGIWQVKYEKQGYKTAYSEWLPVPPPQTEVHVSMISNDAPRVKAVSAYKDGIRIEFDQYMDLETVNADNVSIEINGSAVRGTIEPINSEAYAVKDGFEDSGTTLFYYTVKDGEAIGAAINVTLNGETKSTSIIDSNNFTGKISIALYDAYGRLLGVQTFDAAESVNASFDSNTDGAYAKIMWWDSLDTMRPLYASQIIRFNPAVCTVTVTANGKDYTKAMENLTYTGKIIAALYKSDGSFAGARALDAQSGVTADFGQTDGAYVKLFWWSGFDTMRPLNAAETILFE